MKRKIFILIFSYFAMGILTFTSCESLFEYEATICDIEFAGINSFGKTDNGNPDTFDNQIGFGIFSVHSSPTCYLPQIQIFYSAYATTKCTEFQNRLLQSTYQLSLDRPIKLNNSVIAPHTDILKIPAIISLTDIKIIEDCKLVESTIIFKQELNNQIDFETGEYEVTFKCSTSDNREFTKKRKVIFKK